MKKRWISLLILFLWCFNLNFLFAAAIKFRIVALNPSKVKTQRVPIKIYLPEEVKPQDVLDLGGLNLEFDAQKSLFYVYKDNVILKPGQTKIFEVEVKDIWIIPQEELDTIKEKVNILLGSFKDSPYYEKIKNLSTRANALIDEIAKSQSDESVSRSQHIGIYRTNKKALAKLKEEVAEMERLLETVGGPLTPHIFAKTKFRTEAPTKTATWLIIFSVIIFVGLLALVFFFTWYRQSKITHTVISQAKKESFFEEETPSSE
jgi:hypothetical protein